MSGGRENSIIRGLTYALIILKYSVSRLALSHVMILYNVSQGKKFLGGWSPLFLLKDCIIF